MYYNSFRRYILWTFKSWFNIVIVCKNNFYFEANRFYHWMFLHLCACVVRFAIYFVSLFVCRIRRSWRRSWLKCSRKDWRALSSKILLLVFPSLLVSVFKIYSYSDTVNFKMGLFFIRINHFDLNFNFLLLGVMLILVFTLLKFYGVHSRPQFSIFVMFVWYKVMT